MTKLSRAARGAAGAVAVLLATACNDFLAVENPNAVNSEALGDSAFANLLVSGALTRLQGAADTVAIFGALMSDEIQSSHANVSFGDMDRRSVTASLDLVALSYTKIHLARFAADTANVQLARYGGAAAGRDIRRARLSNYAGYAYVWLAEQFCSSPVNGSAPLTTVQLFDSAKVHFDSAITVATAYRAQAGLTAAQTAAADEMINLARVGAARALLGRGGSTVTAIRAYTDPVPTGFAFRLNYKEGVPLTPGLPINGAWIGGGRADAAVGVANGTNVSGQIRYSAGDFWMAVGAPFRNLNDPRMPTSPTQVRTMSTATALTNAFAANKTVNHGGYLRPTAPGTVTEAGAAMTPGQSLRIASKIEAEYIAAEVELGAGNTAPAVALIARERAANGRPASTAATPAAVLADLIDERRRELFLAGHRLGDLRRYKARYNLDFFPTGAFPAGGTYGTSECMPIPLSERNANPNVPQP